MQHRDRRPLEELSQASRALEQRQVAQILAVEVQEVEGIEVKPGASMPAFRPVQQREIGEAGGVGHDHLAV